MLDVVLGHVLNVIDPVCHTHLVRIGPVIPMTVSMVMRVTMTMAMRMMLPMAVAMATMPSTSAVMIVVRVPRVMARWITKRSIVPVHCLEI